MRVEEKLSIFNWLQENGYLEYGTLIPREILEKLFNAGIDDGWGFLGPYLAIKTYLEEEGLMSTNEGYPPGSLKIYGADEIADQVNRIVVNAFKRLRRAQKCMVKTKMDNLDDINMKRHWHESNKLESILYSIRDKLKELE